MICSATLPAAQGCVRKIILKNVEKHCRCTTEAKIPNLAGETEGNDAKYYGAWSAFWPAFEPSTFRTRASTQGCCTIPCMSVSCSRHKNQNKNYIIFGEIPSITYSQSSARFGLSDPLWRSFISTMAGEWGFGSAYISKPFINFTL